MLALKRAIVAVQRVQSPNGAASAAVFHRPGEFALHIPRIPEDVEAMISTCTCRASDPCCPPADERAPHRCPIAAAAPPRSRPGGSRWYGREQRDRDPAGE